MLSFGAAQLPTAVLPEDDLTNRGDRFCFVHLSIDALSAFSFPSFACSIAGVASGLPLFFHGGFPRGPLSEFHIAGLLLTFSTSMAKPSARGHSRSERSACARCYRLRGRPCTSAIT